MLHVIHASFTTKTSHLVTHLLHLLHHLQCRNLQPASLEQEFSIETDLRPDFSANSYSSRIWAPIILWSTGLFGSIVPSGWATENPYKRFPQLTAHIRAHPRETEQSRSAGRNSRPDVMGSEPSTWRHHFWHQGVDWEWESLGMGVIKKRLPYMKQSMCNRLPLPCHRLWRPIGKPPILPQICSVTNSAPDPPTNSAPSLKRRWLQSPE